MTSEQLVTIILGILGVLLQLALKYAPKLSNWYNDHQNKGLIALGLSALIGIVYFALGCTPYAAQLHVTLACTEDSVFTLLNAIFVIASAQQLTYLYGKNTTRASG